MTRLALVLPCLVGLAHAEPASEAGFRYVQIVDVGGYTDSDMTPGADIDAVEVVRGGAVVGNATRVLHHEIRQGDYGNGRTDPTAALGSPDHPPSTPDGFVALGGPGGFVMLELSTSARVGDVIRVHEIGSRHGGRAEHTEVCVSPTPDGPWMPIGSGYAVFDLTVGPAAPANENSRCKSLRNT